MRINRPGGSGAVLRAVVVDQRLGVGQALTTTRSSAMSLFCSIACSTVTARADDNSQLEREAPGADRDVVGVAGDRYLPGFLPEHC